LALTSPQWLPQLWFLRRWIQVPYNEVNFFCAGINHQAFFLKFRHFKKDLYPLIRDAIQRPEVYGEEPVRIELMKHFGYFVTESSGHSSEYFPYFRKSAKMVAEELVPKFTEEANSWLEFGRTGGYLHHCQRRLDEFQREHEGILAEDPSLERTHEYGSYVIEAIETDKPIRINGNVPNTGLIENLPQGCCVEVPCLADSNGIQPTNAFLHDPRILLLDEPTSSVEPEREALIRDSLEELSESRRSATSLFISATPRPTAVNQRTAAVASQSARRPAGNRRGIENCIRPRLPLLPNFEI
jgi:alpha-galactosidase